MPENNEEQERRDVIKGIGATGIGALSSGVTISTLGADSTSASTDGPELEWSDHTHAETDPCGSWDIRVGLGLDVGFYGATWIDSRNAWEYNFREDSCSGSEYACDGSDLNAIERQEMFVSQGNSSNVAGHNGPEYTGAHPKFVNDPYNYSDLALDLAEVAVAEVSQVVNFVFTASEIVGNLHYDEGESTNNYPVHHDWDYYSRNSYQYGDVSHYKWWSADADPGEETMIDIFSRVYGLFDTNCELSFTFEFSGGDPPDEVEIPNPIGEPSYTTDDLAPAMDASLEEWHIEKIPRGNIEQRASDLKIPDSTVRELKESGEPAYFAHTPPIELKEVTKGTP